MDTPSGTTESAVALRPLPGRLPRRPPGPARPDLQVPLYPPGTRPAALVRSTLVRLTAPRFAEARLANRWWLLALVALWAGQFSMLPQARPYFVGATVALMVWLFARVCALVFTERRQRRYEERWLAAQSEALRDTWFEVVGCTLQRRSGPGADGRHEARYAPAGPADVRELLARQAEERLSGRYSRLTVEFTFPLPGSPYNALEVVDVDLADVDLVTTARRPHGGAVRFPQAAYHPETPRGPRRRHRPSRSTFWVLGPPVLALAAPADDSRTAAVRDDTSAVPHDTSAVPHDTSAGG